MNERKPPVEFREATVDDVDFSERIITVIAVPYEEFAQIQFRGEVWQEKFERGAFTGITSTQRRVPVNLLHDPKLYVGRVGQFFPERQEGLVTEMRIYPGADGDRTLEIARDDGYSASIGFGVRNSDQILDRRAKTRSIQRAFIDHVALVPSPAYEGAGVLSVRTGDGPDDDILAVNTPATDEFFRDPVFQWAADRLIRKQTS